jgi:arylsulfatase
MGAARSNDEHQPKKRGFFQFRDKLVAEGRLPDLRRPERSAASVGPLQRPDRPNVLWIMADQLRGDTFGFMGHPVCRTPALDRLAAQGMVFTRSYCSQPVCEPSRATMLTGHNSFRNGVLQNGYHLRDGEVTLPELLARTGYRTANIGKTHCGRPGREIFQHEQPVRDVYGVTFPSDVPFDPALFPGTSYLGGAPLTNPNEVISGTYPGPVESTKSYSIATQARVWLEQHTGSTPFFLRVSFDDPHPPIVPPEPYASMYSPADVPDEVIGTQEESMAGKPATVGDWQAYKYMDRVTEDEHRAHAARYWGLVSHLDAQIGRVLDYLDELGLADSTIVVMNSDHGQMTGEHGLIHKGPYLYDGITRIPTIVSWPGNIGPGRRSDSLVSGVDLMPTLLDLLGEPLPEDLHGRSWRPLLEGRTDAWREAVFMQWEDYVFGVRTDRYKLTWYDSDEDGELYDLDVDPLELHNVYHESQYQPQRRELLDRLGEWRSRYARRDDLPRPV